MHAELTGSQAVLKAAGIACRIVGAPPALTEEVETALGWVVREGTTNVLRHSAATHCTVTVSTEDGQVTLVMENDATVPARSTSGTGLIGLAERLARLDGQLVGEPLPGGRFRLTARIPVRPDPRRNGTAT